ncbi:helix-turn-helix domain-containing protein [Burkholderia cepacia]|uniref:helix-turn-helix domain-containing protein n=1 Tax=Burkholderia cepacia TaxID=292 RepID=UPI0039BFDC3C
MGLKPGRAAERLGVTVRQLQRLVDRYRESGAAGLASRKRGRPGNRRLDADLADRALSIIRDHYADFAPTHQTRYAATSSRVRNRTSVTDGFCAG